MRIWRTTNGQPLGESKPLSFRHWPLAIRFKRVPQRPKRIGETELFERSWIPEPTLAPQVMLTSAKVVLVGDSDVGKSCLALRLVEDRFEQKGSTHGMQIWTLPPDKLATTSTVNTRRLRESSSPEERELFLWDLGGQTEYQLVHQLFLHDTNAALVLFDPTRGDSQFASVDDWNRRLEAQVRGREIRKLLVRSKSDLGGVVDYQRVKMAEGASGFAGFCEVSAQSGTGVSDLLTQLNSLLAWDEIARITRPSAYQAIRECLQEERKQSALVFYAELVRLLAHRRILYREEDLETVLQQLALEGQIVDVRLAHGDRVIVLRLDAISRYAGSLILAARDQPRGVPMLEPDRILAADMRFPAMAEDERLDRSQERPLIECVVQLLLERGICLEHAGILVFPTLFSGAPATDPEGLSHPRPLYYDFDGPVDNIYAALVARLALSGEFGGIRLWRNRASTSKAESYSRSGVKTGKEEGGIWIYTSPTMSARNNANCLSAS